MKYLCVLLVVFCWIDRSLSQVPRINTVIGNGYNRDTGDGGLAIIASMCNASCSSYDHNGNFYISERFCSKIRKINTSGIVVHFAGNGVSSSTGDGGAATAATFMQPGVAKGFDSIGNMYIMEGNSNGRVRKIELSTGIITAFAGNGTAVDNGDGGQATAAGIYGPDDICFDKHQNLYIATGSNYIRKVDALTRVITTIAGTGYSGHGGDGGSATAAVLSTIGGVYVDSNDLVYVADGLSRVRKIDQVTHIITTIAGDDTAVYNGDGIPATAARLLPLGITGDFFGNLFIADYGNHRIRKIDPSGIIHTVAGTGTPGFSGDGGDPDSAMLHSPQGIISDDCGNLIFNDNGNIRIRKVVLRDYPTITINGGGADNALRLCYPIPLTFTTTVTLPGYAPVYQWRVNGVNVGTNSPTYTYTPGNGDSVQCSLVSNLYCVTSPNAISNTIHITLDTFSPPVVTVSGVSGAPVGSTVTLNANITGAASSYTLRWFNYGSPFAVTTVPTTSYTKVFSVDSISVSLSSTAKGCYDSVVSPVKVVLNYPASVTSVPAGLHVWCYPNPVGDRLTIECEQEIQSVVITDVLGKAVWQGMGTGARNAFVGVGGWVPGLYFVRVNGEGVEKFIKK